MQDRDYLLLLSHSEQLIYFKILLLEGGLLFD